MKQILLHKHSYIYQSIQYYLLFSYAFEILGLVSADTAADHLELASKLLSAGKYSDALPHYHEAINNDPNNYHSYFERATALLALNKPNSALEDLNKALELNPKFTSALSQRAGLLVKMGNLDEAHKDYEILIKLEPENSDAVMMYNRTEKLKKEILNAQELVQVNKFDIALNIISPIVDTSPLNATLLGIRANALEMVGDIRRAITDYRKIAKLSNDTATYLTIAKLCYKLGEIEESLNNIRKCLNLDPNHRSCTDFQQSITKTITPFLRSRNYASSECAKVIESNPEAKKSSHIINEMIDEYMLNPCKAKIWFVIELCDSIKPRHLEIANYELYSSTLKDFTVYFSDTYPALDWRPIGHFTASDSRTLQSFALEQSDGFGKFIKIELNSHYGNEHYCVISEVKIYGDTMVDEYRQNSDEPNEVEIKLPNRRLKRKTSAYRAYRNMMVEPYVCGLTIDLSDLQKSHNNTSGPIKFYLPQEQPMKPLLPPQPTQQPIVNRDKPPLKPSIFVELKDRVKALETSLKTQIEELERRLSERLENERKNEARIYRLELQFKSFALIIIAYYVYKLMLDLM